MDAGRQTRSIRGTLAFQTGRFSNRFTGMTGLSRHMNSELSGFRNETKKTGLSRLSFRASKVPTALTAAGVQDVSTVFLHPTSIHCIPGELVTRHRLSATMLPNYQAIRPTNRQTSTNHATAPAGVRFHTNETRPVVVESNVHCVDGAREWRGGPHELSFEDGPVKVSNILPAAWMSRTGGVLGENEGMNWDVFMHEWRQNFFSLDFKFSLGNTRFHARGKRTLSASDLVLGMKKRVEDFYAL